MKNLFNPDRPNIYTMPPRVDFLGHLAKGLHLALGADLHTAMILLPTRRAARELSAAFLKTAPSGGAILLPTMRTLADMDENEPPFTLGSVDLGIAPSIDGARYRFELAKLVARKMTLDGMSPDASASLAMTEPLVSLLTDLAMEELGTDALVTLNDEFTDLPAHFQNAAEFAQIIAKHWPEHLKELGLSGPAERRVALLNACADQWEETPPNHPVIIAGSTGTLRATARLMKAVSKMEKGIIVLPGLDTHIDDVVWDSIDDQHPQSSLKNLIGVLGVERENVAEWPEVELSHASKMRSRILGESLIPADATSDWPERIARVQTTVSTGNPMRAGLDGLSLIEARTEEEEAGLIALLLRETLETPDKTGILITPDPALARRVKAKLSRFGVEVDTSQGEPLEETLHGSFLALSVAAALDPFDPISLSALVKHKLFALQADAQPIWQGMEKRGLRGPRVRSLDALAKKLKGKCDDGLALFKRVQSVLAPLIEILLTTNASDETAYVHTQVLETLAGGTAGLWSGEAGEKAAQVLEELISYGHHLPTIKASSSDYPALLGQMMRGRVVRPRYGTSERVQILGPLEARMVEADLIILGGLNEGVWPAAPAPHPILSRGMRVAIGLSVPERRFGLAAHDFAQLAAKENIVLTRSLRTSEGPSVQSRWLWRLTTLVKGAQEKEAQEEDTKQKDTAPILERGEKYLYWARQLDTAPNTLNPANRPAPKPPLDTRWPKGRGLSVTQIQTWIRDPYAIYAKNILDLRPLDALDQNLGGREYGTAIHRALEKIDTCDAPALQATLQDELRNAGYEDHSFARHTVRLENMAIQMVEWAKSRRADGWRLGGIEDKKRWKFEAQSGEFELTGIPDRIEIRGEDAAIIDYKTGVLPSQKIVAAGFDPQLPLLSLMLAVGCFDIKAVPSEMHYVKPNGKTMKDVLIKSKDYDAARYQEEAFETLENLIAHFDDPSSAYYSQPRALFVNPYGDYDQLARRAEWARLGPDDGGKE